MKDHYKLSENEKLDEKKINEYLYKKAIGEEFAKSVIPSQKSSDSSLLTPERIEIKSRIECEDRAHYAILSYT